MAQVNQSQIRQLQNPSRTTDIYPLTVEQAVFDDDGVQLPTKLSKLFGDVALLFGDVAIIEGTDTASRAYVPGDFILYEGQLYRVIEDIASRDRFVPGSNIIATKIMNEIVGGVVLGVKGEAESTYRRGNVNITHENLGERLADLVTTAKTSLVAAVNELRQELTAMFGFVYYDTRSLIAHYYTYCHLVEDTVYIPELLAVYDPESRNITLVEGTLKIPMGEDSKSRGSGSSSSDYSLPSATTYRLGGVIVGNGLSVGIDGTLSVDMEATAAGVAGIIDRDAVSPTNAEIDAMFGIVD